MLIALAVFNDNVSQKEKAEMITAVDKKPSTSFIKPPRTIVYSDQLIAKGLTDFAT